MKKFKVVCIVVGVLHASAMIPFALSTEFAPLMIYAVDYPVAVFTFRPSISPLIAYGVPIVACSILYPLALFHLGRFVVRVISEEPAR